MYNSINQSQIYYIPIKEVLIENFNTRTAMNGHSDQYYMNILRFKLEIALQNKITINKEEKNFK